MNRLGGNCLGFTDPPAGAHQDLCGDLKEFHVLLPFGRVSFGNRESKEFQNMS